MIALLLTMAMAWAPGHEARTANFLVFAEDEALARQVSHDAEAARRAVSLRWSGREAAPSRFPCVIFVRVAADVQQNGQAEWVLDAFHTIKLGGRTAIEAQAMVGHEVAHAWVRERCGADTPRWASEGIAVDSELGYPLRLDEAVGTWPLRDFVELGRYPAFDWQAYYGTSYSLCRFLLERHGREAFWAFVDDAATLGWDESSEKNLGMCPDLLEAEWLKWIVSFDSPYPKTLRGR